MKLHELILYVFDNNNLMSSQNVMIVIMSFFVYLLQDQMRDIAGTDEDGNQQPITEEIYRQVMPPPRNRRTRRCFAPRAIASEGNRIYHVIELQNEVAEMKKKEEERQAEIDEIKRNSQEKDEERQREIDDMKRQFQKHCETMEERVMLKLLETVPMTRMLNATL